MVPSLGSAGGSVWKGVTHRKDGEEGADGLGEAATSQVAPRLSNYLGYCGDELAAIPDSLELLGNGVLRLWEESRRGAGEGYRSKLRKPQMKNRLEIQDSTLGEGSDQDSQILRLSWAPGCSSRSSWR